MRRLVNSGALLAVLVTAFIFSFAPKVSALNPFDQTCSGGGSGSQFCGNVSSEAAKNTNPVVGPNGIITTVIQVIVYLVGAISILMVIIGGFRYVVSGGDSGGVAGAKNTILYALVGLVVALLAQVLVSFVLSKL